MDRNDIDVANALGRIEGKLDSLIKRDEDKETRLRSLERKSAWAAGAAAVAGALSGFFAHLFFGKTQ